MTASTDARLLASRDVRRGGHWTRGQRAKNACIRWTIRAALALADRTPAWLLRAAGRALGLAIWTGARGARRAALAAIADALPDADADAVARASFVNFGDNLATTLLLRRRPVRALELIDVDDGSRELLAATLAEGRGAVFVSAHLGPFEVVAAAIAELGHRPVAVVRESYDPALDRVVDRHRTVRGVHVIHRGRAGAAIAIVRALRDNRPVGFLPDLPSRVPTTPVWFLGRQREIPFGPQLIAIRTGAPVLVGTLAPPGGPGGRMRLVIERIDLESGYVETTHRVMRHLERRIHALPRDYLWVS